ncbi:MAG: hypothetical protein RLZZ328_1412 [Bacteroidota bacterium]|jgi:hypothetical protein
MSGHTLYINHPDKENIDWKYLDKDTYLEIESIFTKNVKFFEPFLVDNFYPQEMFDELVEICNSYDLTKVDFSHQMNKWEEGIDIPKKFIDYAVEKVKSLLEIDDVMFGYHMYAHHQITSEGRVPKLPLHIDWAPGSYMIDLQIGGNRDWGFVAKFENFVCKPNQAVICQPQFDYHYRPSWANDDPNEYYQAIFFHLINKDHWCVPSESPLQNRDSELNKKYNFGSWFRDEKVFGDFQNQRRYMFDKVYLQEQSKLEQNGVLPAIPWSEIPTAEDAAIHQRKGVEPAKSN